MYQRRLAVKALQEEVLLADKELKEAQEKLSTLSKALTLLTGPLEKDVVVIENPQGYPKPKNKRTAYFKKYYAEQKRKRLANAKKRKK